MVVAILGLFLALTTACRAETTIAILGEETDPNLAAVLTAELGQQQGVALVERDKLRNLEAERKLTLSHSPDGYRSAGEMLAADGLLILRQEPGSAAIQARLVAAAPGVVIAETYVPTGGADAQKAAHFLRDRFSPLFGKLKVETRQVVAISLLNFRASTSQPSLLALEGPFTTLMASRLAGEPKVFLLERLRADALQTEEFIKGEKSFWTARWVLEGTLEAIGDKVRATAVLQNPGAPTKKIFIDFDPKTIAQAVDDLAQQIVKHTSGATEPVAWNREKEAAQFESEARWCLAASLPEPGLSAANAAWALGSRSFDLARNRTLLAAKCVPGGLGGQFDERSVFRAIIALEAAEDLVMLPADPASTRLKPQEITFFRIYDSTKALRAAYPVLKRFGSAESKGPDGTALMTAWKNLNTALEPLAANEPRTEYQAVREFRKVQQEASPLFPMASDDLVAKVEASLGQVIDGKFATRDQLYKRQQNIFDLYGRTTESPAALWEKLQSRLAQSPYRDLDTALFALSGKKTSTDRAALVRQLESAYQAQFPRMLADGSPGAWYVLIRSWLLPEEIPVFLQREFPAVALKFLEELPAWDYQFLDFVSDPRRLSSCSPEARAAIHQTLSPFARRIRTPSGRPDYYTSSVNSMLTRMEAAFPELSRSANIPALRASRFWTPSMTSSDPVDYEDIVDWHYDGQSTLRVLAVVPRGNDTQSPLLIYEINLPDLTSNQIVVPLLESDSVEKLIVDGKRLMVSGRRSSQIWDGSTWSTKDFPIWDFRDGWFFRLTRDENDHQELSRRKEAGGPWEILVSTRRKPALNQFEDKKHIHFRPLFTGPGGRLCMIIEMTPWYVQNIPGMWQPVVPNMEKREGFVAEVNGPSAYLFSSRWNVYESAPPFKALRPIMQNVASLNGGSVPAGVIPSSNNLGERPPYQSITSNGKNVATLRRPDEESQGLYGFRWFSTTRPVTDVPVRFQVPRGALQAMRVKPDGGSSRLATNLAGLNPKLDDPELFLFPGGLGVIDEHGVWIFSEDEIKNWGQPDGAASR